jgi:hypothetical protein
MKTGEKESFKINTEAAARQMQPSMDTIKQLILCNKDDLIENTFCYELFENGFFVEEKILFLIEQVECLNIRKQIDKDIKDVLIWIANGTDQCFFSHHDVNDVYFIKNYSIKYETQWNTQWKKRLLLKPVLSGKLNLKSIK